MPGPRDISILGHGKDIEILASIIIGASVIEVCLAGVHMLFVF